MKQIYLDNGATSFPKAPGVGQAMKDYIEKVGVNVNRSSYRATAEAALSTLTVREDLCRLFGAGEDPSYAIFTSGVTMSLNMIMKGALHPGDHLIISGMEHNAVARPATQLEAAGVAYFDSDHVAGRAWRFPLPRAMRTVCCGWRNSRSLSPLKPGWW